MFLNHQFLNNQFLNPQLRNRRHISILIMLLGLSPFAALADSDSQTAVSQASTSTSDEEINLNCENLTHSLITQLHQEGLVTADIQREAAIKTIALSLCSEAEASAQQQHQINKKAALDNWFMGYHVDKAGNRRLKNKR